MQKKCIDIKHTHIFSIVLAYQDVSFCGILEREQQLLIFMHRDKMWNWEGIDNRFHIAGYGAHIESKFRFTFFRNFYVQKKLLNSHMWFKVSKPSETTREEILLKMSLQKNCLYTFVVRC